MSTFRASEHFTTATELFSSSYIKLIERIERVPSDDESTALARSIIAGLNSLFEDSCSIRQSSGESL